MIRWIAAFALLGVFATSSASPMQVQAPAIKLYALDCGRFDIKDGDDFADDGSLKGVAQTLVVPCFLIRHPAGDLLWDTGLPEALADAPNGFDSFGEHLSMRHKLTAQLADLGLTPADIEFLSLSHLHADHSGNANLFVRATWIVDVDERKAMFSAAARASAQDFANYSALEHARTLLIEGNASHDVFDDGSVVIHQAPGHTPGHCVLMVRLAHAGPVLLTGDMWHLAASRARRLVPRFNTDRAQTLVSMDKVEALARHTHARIVRQHVPEDVAALPAFPAALE